MDKQAVLSNLVSKLEMALERAIDINDFRAVERLSARLESISAELPESLFTPEDLARIVSVEPGTIKQWCRDGKIDFLDLAPAGSKRIPRWTSALIQDITQKNFIPVSEHFR